LAVKDNPFIFDSKPMIWKVETIIFDFDGVLVDTCQDIANSVNHVLRQFGLKELPSEKVATLIGGGLESIIRQALGESNEKHIEEALPIYRRHYSENCLVTTVLYPGIAEVLEHFHRCKKRMAIATNKAEPLTRLIIKGLGIEAYFEMVVGPESVARQKPHPDMLVHIAHKLGTSLTRTIMIGDTPTDIQAAKAAQVLSCGVTYGYSTPEEILRACPDLIVHWAEDLPRWIR